MDAATFAARSARFAPVDVVVDLGPVTGYERFALAKLVEASRIVDALFLRQRRRGMTRFCRPSRRTARPRAKGLALQVNWLLDRRAVRVARDGTFAVDLGRVRPAVDALTREIMTMQATGDYAKARDWMQREIVIRPEVQRVLDRLEGVPVDIRPRFVTAEQLVADSQGRR